MDNSRRHTLISTSLLLITLVGYFSLAYVVSRNNFTSFISIYSLLFAVYFFVVYKSSTFFEQQDWKVYLGGALLLRLVWLGAIPMLTDDFWRYLWDGRLLTHGINPYHFLPSELLTQPIWGQANLEQLYSHLNSPNYYNIYPPIQQFLFAICSFFFKDNVLASIMVLRCITIAFEGGTIYLLIKLFQHYQKPITPAFLYAFNPLIIIELTGNLHTESSMIFFLTLAFYKLCQQQLDKSAFSFALAVGAKLIPLLLLPLILKRLWFWKGFRYCLIVGVITIIQFLPFFTIELVQKMQESMRLYFAHFEFNASVYYVVRYWVINEWWHLWRYHEHFMHVVWVEDFLRMNWYDLLRQLLPIIDLLFILLLSFGKGSTKSPNQFFKTILFIFTTHILLATTVHPWYLSGLILFSVLTPFRFVLIWSYLIGWTYCSYHLNTFAENSWIIGVEYCLTFAFLLLEMSVLQQKNKFQ